MKPWRELWIGEKQKLFDGCRAKRKKEMSALSGTMYPLDEIDEALEKARSIMAEPVKLVQLPAGFEESHLTLCALPDKSPDYIVGQTVTTYFYGRRWKAKVKEVKVRFLHVTKTFEFRNVQ